MKVIHNSVLLLKAETDNSSSSNKYVNLLQNEGFTVMQAKSLIFTYNNLKTLKELLNFPDDFSGIVFLSPRCVTAVQKALEGAELHSSWKNKYNYAVGEATYNCAMNILSLKCRGKDSNNAKNLANFIKQENVEFDKPLLHPHGNLSSDVLCKNLENTVKLHSVCVYESISNPSLLEDMKEILKDFSIYPEYIIFFSPSGIAASKCFIDKIPEDQLKLIAIGTTTTDAILTQGWKVFATAKEPSPESVLDIIKK